MTSKNGFVKSSLFVLSASEWKDQNMASLFSRQRKPKYREGIVRLANRVAVWRQSKVSVDFYKVLGHEVFSPERSLNQASKSHARLYQFDKPIKSLYFRRLLFLLVRAFSFQGHSKIALSDDTSGWVHTINTGQFLRWQKNQVNG